MTDSKHFTINEKGEIFELKAELNKEKKEKRKEAVKKVIVAMTMGKDIMVYFPCCSVKLSFMNFGCMLSGACSFKIVTSS
uniref:Adaptor related protein complex 2 subunit beta 1 n=1 Tax=Ursus americanus TaxID=9643 RepID=A0A452SGC2_URSAM